MKIKKRVTIVADVIVDEDFDTNYLCLCQDIGDRINSTVFVGRSEDFEVIDYVEQTEIELGGEQCQK